MVSTSQRAMEIAAAVVAFASAADMAAAAAMQAAAGSFTMQPSAAPSTDTCDPRSFSS